MESLEDRGKGRLVFGDLDGKINLILGLGSSHANKERESGSNVKFQNLMLLTELDIDLLG